MCTEHEHWADDIPFVDVVKCLVFLLFHNQLSKKECNEISWWNGRLGGNLISIVSVIYPFFTGKEWEAIESWAILKLSPFFEGLNLRLINQALRYIQNENNDKKFGEIFKSNEKEDMVEPIASNCLHKLSTFNYLEIEEQDSTASKKGALMKAMIDQTRGIVRNLVVIYEDSCKELIDKLTSSIVASLDKEYLAWKENVVDVPFSELLQNFSNFEKNLGKIAYYFGFFGRAVWCAILTTGFFQIILPMIKERMADINRRRSTEIQQEHTNLLYTFQRLKCVLAYCTQDQEVWSKEIHLLFGPYLTAWSQLIIVKAETQITRVLKLEKDKFANKDKPDSGEKHTSGVSNLSVIYEDNEEESRLEEFERMTELEGARDVRGIFQTCVQGWEKLGWDDPMGKPEFGVKVF